MDKGGKGDRKKVREPVHCHHLCYQQSPPPCHHHDVIVKAKICVSLTFFFFSTEFDEKDMTTVPGSHLVEPRVYSKASFLILFGGKF